MRRNKILLNFLILTIIILPIQTKGQKVIWALKKQVTNYKNYIWIEGENAVATNFAKEKTYNFFCSNKFALQLSKEADPSSDKGYYATYTFYVPRSKKYDFWMGCTPPGSNNAKQVGYASPFDWKIDQGSFRNASAENTYVKKNYAPGSFYWVKISSGKLSAGKHTLTIRINQKRSSGWDYYFYIDAILFLPTYSDQLISLMKFPEAALKEYSTKKKSVKFETKKTYLARIKAKKNYKQNVFTLLQVYSWLYEYNKAIGLCRQYLRGNSRDIQIRLLLASNLAWADQLDEAIKEYKNIINIDKKNITARKLLAVLAGWNNRYDEAIRNYKEIIKVDPKNIDAYVSLGTQYSWKGEPDRALGIFQKAEAIAPDNIDVLYALGDNYQYSDKTFKAIAQYKRIISIDEKEINAYKKLAKIYLDQGQKGKAKQIIKQAALVREIYPELSGISLDVSGEQQKQVLASIEEYKRALKKTPEDIETRKNLIDTYRWNKMEKEAIDEYNVLLNVKVFKRIKSTDKRLGSLKIETIKFYLISPYLQSLNKSLIKLKDYYSSLNERLKDGEDISKNIDAEKLSKDIFVIQNYASKIDLLEKSLSRYNDTMSIYENDSQNYYAQKTVLKWNVPLDRIKKQAHIATVLNPKDLRPKKVTGTIKYLYNENSGAISDFQYVYSHVPRMAVPDYILALAKGNRLSEAAGYIKKVKKNSLLFKKFQELQRIFQIFQTEKLPAKLNRPQNYSLAVKELHTSTVSLNKKLNELLKEKDRKLEYAHNLIKNIYEKSFLEMENANVPVYKEIGQYHLNNNQMRDAINNYNNILAVQPLNVDINYSMGNMNGAIGYWDSAMKNYEICINNQPGNTRARKNHLELQKENSPKVSNDLSYFQDFYDGENIVTRMKNTITGTYPVNDLFSIKAGYQLLKIDDKGGITQGGQAYYPSEGSVMRHSAFIGPVLNLVAMNADLFLNVYLHKYSGSVDFNNADYDSDLNYMTYNYDMKLEIFPFSPSIKFNIIYAYEDVAELSQSLKLEFREEVTAQIFKIIMDASFANYDFIFSDRIFLYDSFEYKSLSDSNARTSSFNQLSFRVLRFPNKGIILDLSAVLNYDSSKFIEYDSSEEITSLPYWAPDKIITYSPGIKFEQEIMNAMDGTFTYSLAAQYNYEQVTYGSDNFTQSGYSATFELRQKWDHVDMFASYNMASSTASTSGAKPYTSREFKLGVDGKFFSIYTPQGTGSATMVLASAEPKIITADNDGKDDYTTITLTAFDEVGIASWNLDIYNMKGEKVKTFSNKGTPPPTLKWDGSDKAFNLLPQGEYYYEFLITNTGGKKSKTTKELIFLSRKKNAIILEAGYPKFSPNKDNIKDKINIEIKATQKSNVKSWRMLITDSRKKVVRSLNGFDFVPYDVEWNGKDNNDNILPDGKYRLEMKVNYQNGDIIKSPKFPVEIVTKLSAKISTNRKKILPGKQKIIISTISKTRQFSLWEVNIKSDGGQILKTIHGSGQIPKKIIWKGKDNNGIITGYNTPINIQMEFVDMAGNKTESNSLEAWLDFYSDKFKGKDRIIIFNYNIMHKRKELKLSAVAEKVINQLTAKIKKLRKGRNITITAHTSTDGSSDSNQKLSDKRARQLADILEKRLNIKIKASGMGEKIPFTDDNEKGDSRYEIIFN